MAVPPYVDLLELLLFLVLLAPAGDALLVGWERLWGAPLGLTLLERGLVAFYAAGGALYVLAYVPIGLFAPTDLRVFLVALGALGWLLEGRAFLKARANAGTVGKTSWSRLPPREDRAPLAILLLLTLGTLVFEALVLGSAQSPNTYDGSVQTGFVALLWAEGHAPFTLAPIAQMGVVYPQGTAVWMGSAAALFGWPAFEAPILLPPLFMAFSVPAAYAWGSRMLGSDPARARRAGLLFAASFSLLLTWPRFLVGGSYDFLFALPLFLLALGWVFARRTGGAPSWEGIIFLGLGMGVMASMSPVPPEWLVVALVAIEVFRPARRLGGRMLWLVRSAVVGLLAALFELPTFFGFLVWWSYPSHVLTPVGGLLVPPRSGPVDPWGTFVGYVDPLLFRPQDVWLSPFPLLKVEIALLLAAGVLLLGARATSWGWTSLGAIPARLPRKLFAALVASLLVLLLFTVGAAGSPLIASVGEISSPSELSILLFVIFGAIALFPLLLAWEEIERAYARGGAAAPAPGPPSSPSESEGEKPEKVRRRPTLRPSLWTSGGAYMMVAVLILAVPFASGAAETVLGAPSYLETQILDRLANVSSSDLAADAWMGANLPDCSGVLVSPGSAGDFLPSYNPSIRVIYPLVPHPENLSYTRAVEALSADNYTATTRADLLALEVTEVYVAQNNTVLWPSFELTSFLSSSDFELIYPAGTTTASQGPGAAYVFAFEPTINEVHCAPSGA